MAVTTQLSAGRDRWREGIDNATGNEKWDMHDCCIRSVVDEFNGHLADQPHYFPLDWHLIKAMIWVETGAGSPLWEQNPIQMGNPGDPGLNALLDGKEGGDLILPLALRGVLNRGSVSTSTKNNIRAGVGYLLMRLADFAIKSIPNSDRRTYEVKVRPGDNLDRIARMQGTTIEMMKALNPGAHILRPGQTLMYRKASMKKVIVGWKPRTTSNIARYYNGGGDARYAEKLSYVLPLIRQRNITTCVQ
ncbi:LysM peptidoglycan-binding domain-containing protein [Cupriavidus sp. 30B13]|uniref:LysM peptidoglycan-binding domain-containing protein n=1 Tax=Cupriavidus sp. 30B13 TaxID=3384241 RepID=UPI003B90E483